MFSFQNNCLNQDKLAFKIIDNFQIHKNRSLGINLCLKRCLWSEIYGRAKEETILRCVITLVNPESSILD